MIVKLYDKHEKRWKVVRRSAGKKDIYGGHVPPALSSEELDSALEREDFLNRQNRRPRERRDIGAKVKTV